MRRLSKEAILEIVEEVNSRIPGLIWSLEYPSSDLKDLVRLSGKPSIYCPDPKARSITFKSDIFYTESFIDDIEKDPKKFANGLLYLIEDRIRHHGRESTDIPYVALDGTYLPVVKDSRVDIRIF